MCDLFGRHVDVLERQLYAVVHLEAALALADQTEVPWQKSPGLMVAAPSYIESRGTSRKASDLSRHVCLIYSSVQGDARWSLRLPGGKEQAVPVKGHLCSNSLSAVLDAAIAGIRLAILPWYVAGPSVADGRVGQVLVDHGLPTQDLHAVFPSPKLVPSKVSQFIDWLAGEFEGEWWQRVV